ncbi:hypothetical protein BGW38_007144 [Lunasporangiospora selenospora]|uniref:Phosphatidylinositol transfer protein N-terminal domain-containing protein n=1 Tax=Lunasporangiospora selenospora TaxID=979761 RepID=A0A9P6FKZ4_9FUNG|nr:hypothetical protein BGW38_007144 [Lunasporangiospora selenospora]
MIIKEYRITNNCTCAEYQVAQLFNVAEMSKAESGGGEGVEIKVNEPYEDEHRKGQFTHKIYHLESKVPSWIKALLPAGATKCQEKAWNAFPWCKTVITNDYMADYFSVTVESIHVDNDRGQIENAHNLSPEKLKLREVVTIDVANDPKSYYLQTFNPAKEDVSTFRSEKALRGPLQGEWAKTCDPVMTCYKLVSIEFRTWGLQWRIEDFMHNVERDLFTKFHRELFCSMDRWHGVTMEEIREMEKRTKEELVLKMATPVAAPQPSK